MSEQTKPDFDSMEGPALLDYCGDSGRRWAEAFCHTAKKLGYSDMDEAWVFGWFANAIEHSTDVRAGAGPVVMPDGSAFFVGAVVASPTHNPESEKVKR